MKKIVKDLATDFRRWGVRATRRVQAGVKKYGVVFWEWEHDGKG